MIIVIPPSISHRTSNKQGFLAVNVDYYIVDISVVVIALLFQSKYEFVHVYSRIIIQL